MSASGDGSTSAVGAEFRSLPTCEVQDAMGLLDRRTMVNAPIGTALYMEPKSWWEVSGFEVEKVPGDVSQVSPFDRFEAVADLAPINGEAADAPTRGDRLSVYGNGSFLIPPAMRFGRVLVSLSEPRDPGSGLPGIDPGSGLPDVTSIVVLAADGSADIIHPCDPGTTEPGHEAVYSTSGDSPRSLADEQLDAYASKLGMSEVEFVLAAIADPEAMGATLEQADPPAPPPVPWVERAASERAVWSDEADPAALVGGEMVVVEVEVPTSWLAETSKSSGPRLCTRTQYGYGLCAVLAPSIGVELELWAWAAPGEAIELVRLSGPAFDDDPTVVATIDRWATAGQEAAGGGIAVVLEGDPGAARLTVK